MAVAPTKRQLQAQKTREKIETAALNLFRRRDFEDVTIAAICQAAGVSVGNFYHYFSCKEELLLGENKWFERFVREEFSRADFPTCREAILHLLDQRSEMIVRCGPELIGQMQRVELRRDDKFHFPYGKDSVYNDQLRDLFLQAREEGEIHPSWDPDEAAHLVVTHRRGVQIEWTLNGGNFDLKEREHFGALVLLEGMKYPFPARGTAELSPL